MLPVAPGKTGSANCTITQSLGTPVCTTTPGSDTAAHEMWLRLGTLASQQLVRSIGLPSTAGSQLQPYLNDQSTLPSIFQRLDANRDGKLSADELFQVPAADASSLNSFLAAVREEMAIGAGGEDTRQMPALSLNALSSRPICAGLATRAIDPLNLADVEAAVNTCAVSLGASK